ncbi:MAG: hypothetical protein WCT18_04515 [Patescibacteria group bacterium]
MEMGYGSLRKLIENENSKTSNGLGVFLFWEIILVKEFGLNGENDRSRCSVTRVQVESFIEKMHQNELTLADFDFLNVIALINCDYLLLSHPRSGDCYFMKNERGCFLKIYDTSIQVYDSLAISMATLGVELCSG